MYRDSGLSIDEAYEKAQTKAREADDRAKKDNTTQTEKVKFEARKLHEANCAHDAAFWSNQGHPNLEGPVGEQNPPGNAVTPVPQ